MVTTPIFLEEDLLFLEEDLLYPSSDGQPMAENTRQYRWIVLIKENLEILFRDRDDVFIAGDLLWYPIQVDNPPAPTQAPDVMVIFGRPKGDRLSYKQWEEENIAPQVAFEILSQSNKTAKGRRKMREKLAFYEQYGVEEYYIYDPDKLTLEGYQRSLDQTFQSIVQMSGWVSPLLGIRFDWMPGQELVLYTEVGDRFLSPMELKDEAERSKVEALRRTAEAMESRAEALESRAEALESRAEARQYAAEAQRNKAEANQFKARMEEVEQQRVTLQREAARKLVELGMPIAQVAEVLGLSIEDLEAV